MTYSFDTLLRVLQPKCDVSLSPEFRKQDTLHESCHVSQHHTLNSIQVRQACIVTYVYSVIGHGQLREERSLQQKRPWLKPPHPRPNILGAVAIRMKYRKGAWASVASVNSGPCIARCFHRCSAALDISFICTSVSSPLASLKSIDTMSFPQTLRSVC